MQEHHSCKEAIDECLKKRRFAVAHLYQEEKAMDMHIHDSYEIYFSISGGKQFLIDNRLYDISVGDVFVINQFESHYLTSQKEKPLERIVLSIHPEFMQRISTGETNLDACFSDRPDGFSHRISLSKEQQQKFLYHIDQLLSVSGFGADVLENSYFSALMVFLNGLMQKTGECVSVSHSRFHPQVQEALSYINNHISEPILLSDLSDQLYLSESYLCRIFRSATGTTISKYIIARRISMAKALLASGHSVSESQELCGFGDYSNFLKAFSHAVGISPKKYAQLSQQP